MKPVPAGKSPVRSILCLMMWLISSAAFAAEQGFCPICGMKMPCPMKCIAATTSSTGEKMMLMSGLPAWLFFAGIALVLIVSFVVVEILTRASRGQQEYPKFDILKMGLIKSVVKKPYFKFLFQFPMFLLFLFIIYAGIFGHGIINIAPILTWTIWWAGLVFLILFFGKAWCFVCPWDFVATLFQHGKPFGVSKAPFTLGLKWPRGLKNIYLAIGLFIVLTWFELGFKVTASPRITAELGILMIFLSVVPALIFEKRSFCKYGCLVGRISGLYAMFSPVEVRSKNIFVCASCKTKDCYAGNEKGNPCPTSLVVPQISENTYCILCTECVKSCPHDNVAINIRPFATDLKRFKKARVDEAWLAVILLALTSFHGLTMTPLWDSAQGVSVVGALRRILNIGHLPAFTLAMLLVNGLLMGIYYLICVITRRFAGDPRVLTKDIFFCYAYSILPVALFYHLAHNGMHLFMEGQMVVPLLSDPLGRGMNLFGTAAWHLGPILSSQSIWVLQVGLVLTGHIFGIIIAHYVSRKLYADPKRAMRSLLPMLMGMIFFSFVSLWIMHLDMNMRSSLM